MPRPVVAQAAWLTLLIALTPRGALGHESPHGTQLLWSSEQPDELPAVLTNRGIVLQTQDTGASTYALRCNEAYGVNTAATPHALLDEQGILVLVTYRGVQFSVDRGCSWTFGTGLPALSLAGFTQNPRQPNQLLVSTQSYQAQSEIFRSEDYGRSWSWHTTNQASTAYQTLLSAPDGKRLFASGNRFDAARGRLVPLWARSLDGGNRWQEQTLERTRIPLAVHPTLPQVVLAHQPEVPATAEQSDEVLRSDDGGDTFASLVSVPAVSAFASTPDGQTMWLGSNPGGLYRSDDGGRSFARVHAEQIVDVYCLHYRLHRLWLCARWSPNHGGVWSSDDLGQSWTARMGFDQVTKNQRCAPEQATVCEQPWRDWQYELLGVSPNDAGKPAYTGDGGDTDVSPGPADELAPLVDAGSDTRGSDASIADEVSPTRPTETLGPSSCSVAPRAKKRRAATSVLICLLLALLRRRMSLREHGARPTLSRRSAPPAPV